MLFRSIKLDKTSLTFTVGGTPQKLTATVEPSTATVKWETDDEAVATVVGGLVTPVAVGQCVITAKAGEKSATCKVTVEEEASGEYVWQLGGAGIFGIDAIPDADTVEVELSIGVVKCVPADATLYIWGSGLTYDDGFQGEDYMFICPSKLYLIAAGDYAGYYVGSADGFIVEENDDVYYVEPGKVADNYAQVLIDILESDSTLSDDEVEALYEAWENAISGSFAMLYSGGFYYPFEGLLSAGQIDWDNDDNYYYDLTINWFDYSETALYGIKGEAVYDDNGNVVDFQFTEPYEMQYQQQHAGRGEEHLRRGDGLQLDIPVQRGEARNC